MQTNRIAAIVGGAVLFILGLVIGAAISGGPSVEEIDAAVAKRIEAATAAETAELGKIESGLSQLASDVGGRLDGIAGNVDTGSKTVADIGSKIGDRRPDPWPVAAERDRDLLRLAHRRARERPRRPPRAALRRSGRAWRPRRRAPPRPRRPATRRSRASRPARRRCSPTAPSTSSSRVSMPMAGLPPCASTGTISSLPSASRETVAGAAGECQITLDAVGGGKAAISGACGDALPPPEGAAPVRSSISPRAFASSSRASPGTARASR